MSTININCDIQVSCTWAELKNFVSNKFIFLQYTDDGIQYNLFALDDRIVYLCNIWKGTVPESVVNGGYSQAQNDADKSDFETSYLPYANDPISIDRLKDPRIIHKFGNITTAAVTEVLCSSRTYNEQASQAQRSVKSSSVQDAVAGSGAKAVRLVYLDSNYVKKTETITLNGTTAVATVATDIRFIESFDVVQGAAAVGAIELWTANNGTGTAICGIASATTNAFLCHHYVPSGMRCIVYNWGGTCNDDVSFKLWGQQIVSGNRTDQIIDLDNLTGLTAGTRLSFNRDLGGVIIGEKCYIRVTIVPGQVGSTITRATLDLFEDKS
jgi:hypothetical protein